MQVLQQEEVWRDHREMGYLGSKIINPALSNGPPFRAMMAGDPPPPSTHALDICQNAITYTAGVALTSYEFGTRFRLDYVQR